jgi:hypothetical protein
MATDRDEQTHQQRELEEIRRSFAEMGARMGSLFEPTEPEDEELQPSRPPAAPARPAFAPARPRWWWVGALALLFLAGTAFGWILPKGDSGASASPPPTQPTVTTGPASATSKAPVVPPRTVTSVPQSCVETAELADEVISKLDRNVRDQRLFSALRDYTIASQACRREASP